MAPLAGLAPLDAPLELPLAHRVYTLRAGRHDGDAQPVAIEDS